MVLQSVPSGSLRGTPRERGQWERLHGDRRGRRPVENVFLFFFLTVGHFCGSKSELVCFISTIEKTPKLKADKGCEQKCLTEDKQMANNHLKRYTKHHGQG